MLEMLILPSQQPVSCSSWVVVLFPGLQNYSPMLLAPPTKLNSLLVSPAYKIALPQALGMDNQSAIRVAKNPEHQGRMKHLNPIYYGFREQVEAGEISPHFIPTVDMPADILTKALPREQVEKAVSMLGLQV